MQPTLSFDDALHDALQIPSDRRVLVAHIDQTSICWLGGDVDHWRPDEMLFSSKTALCNYQKLVGRFRKGTTSSAHVLMFHNDGTFGSVMLGVETGEEARACLAGALQEIRIRTSN